MRRTMAGSSEDVVSSLNIGVSLRGVWVAKKPVIVIVTSARSHLNREHKCGKC